MTTTIENSTSANLSSHPQRIYLKDYTPPDYLIDQVFLSFDLHETNTKVYSEIKLRKNPKSKTANSSELFLNGVNLKLISIMINGDELKSTDFLHTDAGLKIYNPAPEFTLKTIVEINPEANLSCEGLYISQGIFCTQCEAESFRKITFYLDRPDVMAPFTVEIIADQKKFPVLLSNGDLVKSESMGSGKHKVQWKDPFKKPSYLFALVAGDLGEVHGQHTTPTGRKIKLSVFASHGKQERCHHALESLKKAMVWDEQRFGLEYDLNQYMIVSIDDFNMGAMENKGLNVFNSRLVLADQKSATDQDFDTIEAVVGHEYFHNWTGNRVTCRNWFELSLKEGLTVFRDQEFSADLHSRSVQRIKDVDTLRARQFPEDVGPNSHPVRPESCLAVDNFYTSTIYEKGSEVIRMMQSLVGREGFRLGMDEYFKRHDGQAVTIEEFAAAISETNNIDFTQFKRWYSQEGTPTVQVNEFYDEKTKSYKLNLKQIPFKSGQQPFHIPLKFGLIDKLGQEIKLENSLLQLTELEQTFSFENLAAKPILSLNREFTAPIRIKSTTSNFDYIHLMKFDSDEFNRREASVKLLTGECMRLIKMLEQGQALNLSFVDPEVLQALRSILVDTKIDSKFKALILQIPSEISLAQEQPILNTDFIFTARQVIFGAIVDKNLNTILEMYYGHHAKNSSGDRALKNVLLSYISAAKNTNALDLIKKQYRVASNMTDRIAALSLICDHIAPERDELLNDFKSIWKDDKVVMNKWFQIQAQSQAADTFERVKFLKNDLSFDSKNPNNIYSLHGAFGSNLCRFHSENVEIYKWYLQELAEIDLANPQAASRISSAFQMTLKLNETTRRLVQSELKAVLSLSTLSKNAREILEKYV
jgi:aminopeptidase N